MLEHINEHNILTSLCSNRGKVSVKSVNHNLKITAKKLLHYGDCPVHFHRGGEGWLIAQVPGSFYRGGERMKQQKRGLVASSLT